MLLRYGTSRCDHISFQIQTFHSSLYFGRQASSADVISWLKEQIGDVIIHVTKFTELEKEPEGHLLS